MLFKNNKISKEEFESIYRPLLIQMCNDCKQKAKSLQSKYKYITNTEYICKDIGCEYDKDEYGKLNVYIFEQGYTYFFVTIMDGSQMSRTTSGAHKYLKEVRDYIYNKYKSKFIKDNEELITITTGDGDEGTIYIEFDTKKLGFKWAKEKYKPLREQFDLFDRIVIL